MVAIETGRVGERYDGYMGFVVVPTDELRRQVDAINIRRRNLYTEFAVQRNVNVQWIGVTTGCALFRQLPVGAAYMLEDKVWRRRSAGESAVIPKGCR
jgi:hypothetical protein